MFGDLVLLILKLWKQFKCVHDYEITIEVDKVFHRFDMEIKTCKNCGRRKQK